MYQGTKTRKPRRIQSAGQTTTYKQRKPSVLAKIAFGTWTIMASVVEAVVVLAGLLVLALACVIVPLLIWF